MDEYDIRRLPHFRSGDIKLSGEDLKCLIDLDPHIADAELRRLASSSDDADKIIGEIRRR